MDWASLPEPTLVRLFEFVPLHQRFGDDNCCALVCRRWTEAAFAATSGISLTGCTDIGSLQLWLQKSGSSLKGLRICQATGELLELPCPKLDRLLLLQDGTSSLRVSDSLCAALTALSALTSLSLAGLELTPSSSAECWTALVALPALQYLALTDLDRCPFQIVNTLQRTLTRLARDSLPVPGLQQLSFLSLRSSTAYDFASSRVPAFSCLTALDVLSLKYGPCDFQPSVLSGLIDLQQLELACTTDRSWSEVARAPAAELLAVLQQLQQLTSLKLLDLDLTRELESSYCFHTPQSPEAFSALTASSRLRRLYLSGTFLHRNAAIWQHVFPCNRQLPYLDTLKLDSTMPSLQPSSLRQLVQCCPALQLLYIRGRNLQDAVDGNPPLAALQQLSALTGLCVTAVPNRMALESLAFLTGLQCLRVYDIGRLTASGLQQLTALKQLTFLTLELCERTAWHLGQQQYRHDESFQNKAPAAHPPDVWAQLEAFLRAKQG